jgi:hypothetical protein
MATIVTRAGKGSPLTNAEVDANFTNLNSELTQKLVASSNLSDLASASSARTNLGLAIGTNVQAWDADLDAIAALAGTSGFLKKTAANTWTLDTSSYLTGNQSISITGDASGSGATSISLTLAASGVTAGTYSKVTVDAKGRVTTGASLASADLPTYTGTLTSGQITTGLGFTPYNSTNPSGYITSSGSITGNAATATSVTGTATQFGLTSSAQNTALAAKAGPEVTGQGGGGAVWSMHRPGAYGLNIGLDSDNVFRIGGWSASSNRLQMDMTGNLTMNGNVTAYSDERLKKDWTALPADFVERLAQVKHGTYTRIDSEERQAGVSAQDFQGLLGEVVATDGDGYLSLAYGNAALVSAVELAKRVVALEAKLAAMQS